MLDICRRCTDKECEQSGINSFEFCRLGVAYYNTGSEIRKKEESVTLRHISHNLRHELNKVLMTIVAEATKIDPRVSTKKIDLESPASRIVGATVIIDQFIEMIAGVNEFHPSQHYSSNLDKKVNLQKLIEKYYKVYSLIENTRRAKRIDFTFNIDKEINVSFSSNIIEYLSSILIDNIWKYSISETSSKITALRKKGGDIDLTFSNKSKIIPNPEIIFNKGFQCDNNSEGFGYGLYWAQSLISHYNELSKRSDGKLELTHSQKIINDNEAEQTFILRNIRA